MGRRLQSLKGFYLAFLERGSIMRGIQAAWRFMATSGCSPYDIICKQPLCYESLEKMPTSGDCVTAPNLEAGRPIPED